MPLDQGEKLFRESQSPEDFSFESWSAGHKIKPDPLEGRYRMAVVIVLGV